MSSQNRASLVTIAVVLVIATLIALAGSQGGVTVAGFPLFAIAVIGAFALQVIVWIPSAILKTERFFDLTGSGTFLVITVALLALAPAPDARSWVLAGMVVAWSIRLGGFLFTRVLRSGSDDRFDEIKTGPLRFLRVWIIQGLWVSVTASAAWIAISVPSSSRAPLEWIGYLGIALWVIGFVIEVVADAQKSRFRADAANADSFISSGLWSRSRHPNYFGEIVLWVGVFLAAAPVLTGWQWVAILSPVFVILLLTRVSGIPLLEARADEKWGERADYVEYRDTTPVLIPRLRR